MEIIFPIILQEPSELQKYYRLLFDIKSPIYVSIFLLLVVIVLLIVSYKYIYNPLLRKHRDEKENLELESAKLLVMFSELDPNPIIRIDTDGKIIGFNKSAKEKLLNQTSVNPYIKDILPDMDFNIRDAISEDKSIVISQNLNDKAYEINFHGISFLKTAQLYFLDVTVKKEYDDQMKIYQKLLRDSSANLQEAMDNEKNRFAGLLHDSIGQNLLLVKMNLQNRKKLIREAIDANEYQKTLDLLDSSIYEVKETARLLRPLNLDELGLVTVLNSMCNKISKESGIKSTLNLPDNNIKLNKELEICIYRVAQEALNNIIKHSKASEFTIDFTVTEDSATLIVSDNGIGFNPKKLVNEKYVSDGMGLLTMQDRVERLNGTFHIDASNKNGTVIIADFLVSKEENKYETDYKNPGSG